MNRKIVLASIMVFSMIISACGAQAEPTIDPANVQNTAVAAAFTVVAQTQAAIPTNTPVPPTDTPSPTPPPTDTPVPLPTSEVLASPTVQSQTSGNNTGGDPCNAPLPGNVTGKPTKIRLINKTKGSLVVSLYLNKTPFGECGYRGYNLSKNDTAVITDLPQGCYNVSVFVTEPNKSSKAFGYGCINNPDAWSFEIYADNVKFVGP